MQPSIALIIGYLSLPTNELSHSSNAYFAFECVKRCMIAFLLVLFTKGTYRKLMDVKF